MQLSAISLFSRRHVTDCIQSRAKGFPFETRPGILRMRKTGRRTGCAFVILRAHVITTPPVRARRPDTRPAPLVPAINCVPVHRFTPVIQLRSSATGHSAGNPD